MYQADQSRYTVLPYRRCGSSGLLLPAVSLGLWHNFGDATLVENSRQFWRYCALREHAGALPYRL